MTQRRKPSPPLPDLIRKPAGRFGWLEDRLLREGWLARMGPEPAALLLLLALAADRHGASYYGREQMARSVGLSRAEVDDALNRLLELGLVAHKPWRDGHVDGVWQILPIPKATNRRVRGPTRLGDILKELVIG